MAELKDVADSATGRFEGAAAAHRRTSHPAALTARALASQISTPTRAPPATAAPSSASPTIPTRSLSTATATSSRARWSCSTATQSIAALAAFAAPRTPRRPSPPSAADISRYSTENRRKNPALDLEADEYFTRLNEAMADPATICHFFWYELGASPLPHPAGSLAPTLRLHL